MRARSLLLTPAVGFGLAVGCGGASDSTDPGPKSATETWLRDHPTIMAALVWDAGDGRGPQRYADWTPADKATLHLATSNASAGTEPTLADPPVNVVAHRLADDFAAVTALSATDARGLYFGYVGRSLMLEMTGALPWSIAEYDATELAILLDSRTFFVWKRDVVGTGVDGYVLYDGTATTRAIFNPSSMVSWVVPAPPRATAAFLSSNGIIGTTRLETIGRLLEWERANLLHFSGAFTLANTASHWQYRGAPPASRIIAGTTRQTSSAQHAHWTAGCPGTNTFMTVVLRAVNIPVAYAVVDEHATASFPTEGLFLSHGDDPYSRAWKRSTPTIPAPELLIDAATYTAWFAPSNPGAQRLANIGRQTKELMLRHLTDWILVRRCEDIRDSAERSSSRVYDELRLYYTLPQLEAMDLWSRLDAKIATRGGCAAIPPV